MSFLRSLSFLFALSVLFLLALPGFAAAQDVQRWRMATSWPGGPFLEQAKNFAAHVEELTQGRVKIQVFPGGALGNPLKISEAVEKGVAQIGHSWTSYEWGKDKTRVLFPGWAGGPQSSEAMLHWYFEGGGLELLQDYYQENTGLKAFVVSVIPSEIMHAKKPVRSLEDLKGLSLRTTGAWMEIASGLGASTVTASGAEVYQMLERGAIDALEWASPSGNISMGFHEIAPYIIVPGIHQPANALQVFINPDAWAKLSAQDQNMIALAAKLTAFESWTSTGMADIEAIKTFKDSGNEIIRLDQDVQDQARKLAYEWAETQAADNEWFARVWQSQKDFMQRWRSVDGVR